jgi:hypothetical protein
MKTIVWRPGATNIIPTTGQVGVPIDKQQNAGQEQVIVPTTLVVATPGDVYKQVLANGGNCLLVIDTSLAPAELPAGMVLPGFGVDPVTGAALTSGMPLLHMAGQKAGAGSITTLQIDDTAQILGLAEATDLQFNCKAVTLPALVLGPVCRLSAVTIANMAGALVPCIVTQDASSRSLRLHQTVVFDNSNAAHPILQLGATTGAGSVLGLYSEGLVTINVSAITQKTAAGTIVYQHDGAVAVGYLAGQCAALVGITDTNITAIGSNAGAAASYTAGTPGSWAGAAPTTIAAALDRLAADLRANLAIAGGGAPVP